MQHQVGHPVPLQALRPAVPAAVAELVARMMAKKPHDRFASAGEVAAAPEVDVMSDVADVDDIADIQASDVGGDCSLGGQFDCSTPATADAAAVDTGDLGETNTSDTGEAVDGQLPADAIGTEVAAAPDADAVADVPDVADIADIQDSDASSNCPVGGKAQCYNAKQLKALIEWQACNVYYEPMCGPWPPPGADSSQDGGGPPVCTSNYAGELPPVACPAINTEPCKAVFAIQKVGDTCCYQICPTCVCGRPFTVAGGTRTAPLVAHSPATAHNPALAALAAAWRADASEEHASIASFYRFGLELLALGAPAELLTCTALAAADEVEHTRFCLQIAQQLDGQVHVAGPFPCGDLQLQTDLPSAAAAAVREGCVGETLAAAQAGVAARGATEAGVAAALARIADDELRHAEVAWRFVAWALEVGGAQTQVAVAAAFSAALAPGALALRADAALASVPEPLQRAWGRLPRREAHRLAEATLAEVVKPCAERLLRRGDKQGPDLCSAEFQ